MTKLPKLPDLPDPRQTPRKEPGATSGAADTKRGLLDPITEESIAKQPRAQGERRRREEPKQLDADDDPTPPDLGDDDPDDAAPSEGGAWRPYAIGAGVVALLLAGLYAAGKVTNNGQPNPRATEPTQEPPSRGRTLE